MARASKTAILGDEIFTVSDLCTPAECAALVGVAEDIGWDAAPITVGPGRFVMAPDVRNNTRVILDDERRAAALWRRLAPFVPARAGWQAVGLNERFRFYRYEPGQYFRWHRDGAFVRDAEERSLLTVMLYLADAVGGGTTEFDTRAGEFQVAPRTGTALVFEHIAPPPGRAGRARGQAGAADRRDVPARAVTRADGDVRDDRRVGVMARGTAGRRCAAAWRSD